MFWDERIEENLRNHDAYETGKHEGIIEGKIEGEIEKRNQMIINMYSDNVDINTIAKYAETSMEEVEKVIKDNHDSK